jgi:hypothetical protein
MVLHNPHTLSFVGISTKRSCDEEWNLVGFLFTVSVYPELEIWNVFFLLCVKAGLV